MEGSDRAVTTLESWWDGVMARTPPWVRWFIGQPAEHPVHAPHGILSPAGHEEKTSIWSDTSLGGHMFHVLSTVWMWMHVLVYACGFLPVWEDGYFSTIIMVSMFILFFVGTEEFVNIKRWRRILAIVVGIHATAVILMLTFRLVMPGTYDYVMAKYGYHETLYEQAGHGINRKTGTDRWWREKLDADERDLLNKQRWNQLDPANHAWTAEDQHQLESVQEVRANMKPEEDEGEAKGTWESIASLPEEHPMWLLVGGILLLAAAQPKSNRRSSGH